MSKWLSPTLVHCPVYLTVCTTEAQYRKVAKRIGVNEPGGWISAGADATLNTFMGPAHKPVCVVCIEPRGKRTRAAYAALLVHEAAHVWQKIKSEIGERDPSAEFEAYSLQGITQSLFEAVGL